MLALSGGFSYASSQFDRAMQAMRQPGSSFKPFVYAAALDNGYTPVSKVLDAPFVMDMGPGQGLWQPDNFEHDFLGDTTLRRGLELSRNVMTVRLAYTLGMDKVVPYPIRFGVYDKLPPLLANSLGAYETTLLRLVTGYSELVNGGKKIQASLVDRIQDRNGKTIWRHDGRNCEGCANGDWSGQQEPLLADTREQIIDPRTAYQIVSMLEGVVSRGTGVSGAGGGQAAGGQDWHFVRSARHMVHRLLARSGGRCFCRLRQSAHPWWAQTRRHRGGPDLSRFHERRAGRCTAHAFPRRAGHRNSHRLEERQSG